MTYDPFQQDRNDPRESPATRRTETGRSEMVVGALLLAFAAIAFVFVGPERRSGNNFMQTLFWCGLAAGLALLAWGAFQRNRGKGDRNEND